MSENFQTDNQRIIAALEKIAREVGCLFYAILFVGGMIASAISKLK